MSNFRHNQNPPPLSLIAASRVILKKGVARKAAASIKVAHKTSGIGATKPKLQQAVLKPYIPSLIPVCAPVPFFAAGRFNSVPESFLPSEEVTEQSDNIPLASIVTDEETLIVPSVSTDKMVNAEYGYYSDGVIVETADKSIQTDSECECRCGNQKPTSSFKDDSTHQLTREVAKLSHIVRDVASKISGKQTINILDYFPINTLADLQKIQDNIDKKENFLLKLDMHLKDLVPANSTAISFGLRQLVTDEFLYGKNWDGRNAGSLKQYQFFNSILFDSWKNGALTKMVYIKAMRTEIKKAHDRHYQAIKSKKNNL